MVISFILFSLVILSVGASFAADTDVADVVALDDEVAVDETLAVGDNQEVSVQTTDVVTNDTFYNYFDSNGILLSNVTSDELTFEGEISGVGVDTMTIDRSINLTGNDVTLKDISLLVMAEDVTVSDFTINQSNGVAGIVVTDSSEVQIENTVINLKAVADYDAYAIIAHNVENLSLLNNTINYIGATEGYGCNNALSVSGSKNIRISENKFNLKLVSCYVPWSEVPPGSGNWVSSPVSEGIVIDDSSVILFTDNLVNVTYNGVCGSYDTIYAVDFRNSEYVLISGNDIIANGHSYIYGLIISAEFFKITGNNFDVTSDVYYANGIDIEGPANGIIEDNALNVYGVTSAYGIYSGMNGADVIAEYDDNLIYAEAYSAFGMSLGDVESIVLNNDIVLRGNYTTGIASKVNKLTAKYNKITMYSSEVGNESIWEDFGIATVGIKVVAGNANLAYNNIVGPGTGITVSGKSMGVSRNVVKINATEDKDAYGIIVEGVKKLNMLKNTVKYVGATEGTGVNNAVLISNAQKATVSGNTIKAELVSCYVPWAEIPAGSGDWVMFPVSEGVVVKDSDDILFESNIIYVKYNNVSGTYDTIYAVDFKDCDNAVIYKNDISAEGHSYIYGLIISGDNFNITDNIIVSESDEYYADGIDVEGPATGLIDDNIIVVEAVTSAYGIYSGMNGADVKANYTENTIFVKSYSAFGMSLGDVESTILNNYIELEGNYTTGIASKVNKLTAKYNEINMTSSEVGNESIWEDFGIATVGIKVVAGNANLAYNKITGPGTGITVSGRNMAVSRNVVKITGNKDKDAYGIIIEGVKKLNMLKNNVKYVGATEGTGVNNAVLISNAHKATVSGNTITAKLVSCYVPWAEIPTGSGNWVSSPISEGVVVEDSDDLVFDSNTINVNYNAVCGSYDTIYAVDFKNSDNVVISGNDIDAKGHSYIYGLIISGDNFNITGNNIDVESDEYYADGIDIEGPATGVVEGNAMNIYGITSAYGIYSGMNGADVKANYTDNVIYVNSYSAFGMSLGDVESTILNNEIILKGNYTTGIASKVNKLTAKYNKIDMTSSEVGNESIWEEFGIETVGIKVVAGNANLAYNNIVGPGIGITVSGRNMAVSRNVVKITGNKDKDACGIVVDRVNKLNMLRNNVKYVGATEGTGLNNAVFISEAKQAIVCANTITAKLVSCYVPWAEVPAGSGNWVSSPISEGVVVEDCEDILFDSNLITVNYKGVCGSYDTIYAVDFRNSTGAKILNNDITANGHTYIYGMIISGDDFTITNNNFDVSSDVYYANGIDIEGPATGVVIDNTLNIYGVTSAYAIYSGMNGADVKASYIDNIIYAEAYSAFGMSLGDVESDISGNNINLNGNYTTGIASKVSKLTVTDCKINAKGSNVGNESIWESFGIETIGIKVVDGVATIISNNVKTTGNYTVDLKDTNSSVTDNTLTAKKLSGNKSVNFTGSATVKNNRP